MGKRQLLQIDHRVLGQQLDLFSINEEVGSGLALWHPKGDIVRRTIRNFWEEEHLKNGYQLVCTPHIARRELWSISGHLDYYEQNMYVFEKDGEPYVLKPMNCPLHIQIYKAKPRSYKDLPIKYAEWGTVYRYERSGVLHGLMRVRGFTQDDAHIFCTPEQVDNEILQLIEFAENMLHKFGFHEYQVYLSTRDPKEPEKYMGSEESWEKAQKALAKALEKKGIIYHEMRGEAVFYGPKIDINIVDASGRGWQCATIQFDFNLPKRFNITYVGADGKEHEVIMIHRALLGSIERFFAILLEHYRGNLPTWLSPIQVRILPISNKQLSYAKRVHQKLQFHGVRAEIDDSPSTINYKIREAETQKIPYMIICGKKEVQLRKISVRKHGMSDVGLLTIGEFIKIVKKESIQ
ncbi:MAG: threonine--tRNA ligase [Candidatus Bathyarchaeia archaeon]